MQFFMIAHERALSVQSDNKRRSRYQERLRHKAEQLMSSFSREWIEDSTRKLYSRTYYFHRRKSDTDADNLSKPALDALTGTVFKDDKQVIWRVAAKINLNDQFVIKDMPNEQFRELLSSINNEQIENILFIEVGECSEIEVCFGREK